MALRREDVDRLLAPEFAAGMEEASLADLRARRDECLRAEVVISYLRRILQGELDLVGAEASLRSSGSRGDLTRLVEDLPAILTRGPAMSREGAVPAESVGGAGTAPKDSRAVGQPAHLSLVTSIGDAWDESSDEVIDELIGEALSSELVETSLPGGALPGASLGTFSDEELATVRARLTENEATLSDLRKRLHARIDELQASIVERYRSGQASSDSLLA
jgi:hypothetical protein